MNGGTIREAEIKNDANNGQCGTTGEKGRKKTLLGSTSKPTYKPKKDKTNVISLSSNDENTNQPPKRVKVEDNIGVPSSSDFHERLLGDMASDFIPLRVVQSGEDVVENELEDLFGTQIVPHEHNFEMENIRKKDAVEPDINKEEDIVSVGSV
ncbi:unnamed protein product [Citrullus colocynthis]|uniref:Uncharacterized protein n=1 Tax=Citrullus colocynthis TaxID=252529 RepID=A0ABP0Y4S5_9ROSI